MYFRLRFNKKMDLERGFATAKTIYCFYKKGIILLVGSATLIKL